MSLSQALNCSVLAPAGVPGGRARRGLRRLRCLHQAPVKKPAGSPVAQAHAAAFDAPQASGGPACSPRCTRTSAPATCQPFPCWRPCKPRRSALSSAGRRLPPLLRVRLTLSRAIALGTSA